MTEKQKQETTDSQSSVVASVLTPTVRVNEFGVRAFVPNLGESVTGHDVIVRDWYGENHLSCTGVVIGRSGYPTALEFTGCNGRDSVFSLHTTREIEIVA